MSSNDLNKVIGCLVSYYAEGKGKRSGSHVGYLEALSHDGKDAVIRPLVAYRKHRTINITVPARYVDVVEIKAAPVKA